MSEDRKMNFEVIDNPEENPLSQKMTVNTKTVDSIKITEILYDYYDQHFDFVLFYFSYNDVNHKKLIELISDYREKMATCLIGCISTEESIDYSSSGFDMYLAGASENDFKNLEDFCISTENGTYHHIEPLDFVCKKSTEIKIVSEYSIGIENLVQLLGQKIKQISELTDTRFAKFAFSIMTNGQDLLLSDVNKIYDTVQTYATADFDFFWNAAENVQELSADEIKVIVILYL